MSRIIAIDGPSGSGKSTVARCLGRKLGFLHVDSGALYRIMTWQALARQIDTSNEAALTAFAPQVTVTFCVRDGMIVYAVNGVEPGDQIRTAEINQHASPVAKVPVVRERVTRWLRELQRFGDLVVEGRDIGSVVFPDSPARFYLDAAPEERARRRHTEEIQKGIATTGEDAVLASLLNRDRIDSSRAIAPLTIAEGIHAKVGKRDKLVALPGELLRVGDRGHVSGADRAGNQAQESEGQEGGGINGFHGINLECVGSCGALGLAPSAAAQGLAAGLARWPDGATFSRFGFMIFGLLRQV